MAFRPRTRRRETQVGGAGRTLKKNVKNSWKKLMISMGCFYKYLTYHESSIVRLIENDFTTA